MVPFRAHHTGFLLVPLLMAPCVGVLAQQQDSVPVAPAAMARQLPALEVTGRRVPQRTWESTSARDHLGRLDLRGLPLADPSAAIGLLRGVHVIDPGIGLPVYNVRGFANTTNVRMVQLTDGRDDQAPHIGAPFGNALSAGELDIAGIEVVPGAESLIRGTNAINGAVLVNSLDPFAVPGVSLRHRMALNADGPGALHLLGVTDARVAVVPTPRTAVKVTVSQLMGTDRPADDRTDLAAHLNTALGLTGPDNPACDPVNGYGNEAPNRRTLELGGLRTVVARTGYHEMELDERSVRQHRGAVELHHRPRKGHTMRMAVHAARSDMIYQRSNRFRMRDHRLGRIGLRHDAPAWSLGGQYTAESTGRSYNMRSLAENMDRAHRGDDVWFAAYAAAWQLAHTDGLDDAAAHAEARRMADEGRAVPGTARFDALREQLAGVNDWDRGAALHVRADMLLSEGHVDWHEALPTLRGHWLRFTTGFDHRQYIVRPDGNYFVEPTGADGSLLYGRTGMYGSLAAHIPERPIRLEAAARIDRCDHFTPRAHYRLAAAFERSGRLLPRVAYQVAHRYPSLFEGFSNVNSGGVRRVGGLRVMSDGIFERSWTSSSIEQFRTLVNAAVNSQGLTLEQALAQHAHVLTRNPYTYLAPETIRSLEGGVRASLGQGAVLIDLDVYLNTFTNLMGQVEASIPVVQDPDSVPLALYDRTLQQRYRLWTNSPSRMYTQGVALGIRWRMAPRVILIGNVAQARLIRTEQEDGLEDAFNTPPWMVNASVLHERIWRQFDAGVSMMHRSAYSYASFLVEGVVPAFWSLDAHVGWHLPGQHLHLRAGGNNVLGRRYRTMLGGAVIGAAYHVTITWTPHT